MSIQPWHRNFNPRKATIQFIPFWVELHSLPLEYKEQGIVETLVNAFRIFLKHDLSFFQNRHLPVRLCVLLDTAQPLPFGVEIRSSAGFFNQKVFIEIPFNVCKICHLLGHKTRSCKGKTHSELLSSPLVNHPVDGNGSESPQIFWALSPLLESEKGLVTVCCDPSSFSSHQIAPVYQSHIDGAILGELLTTRKFSVHFPPSLPCFS